MIKINTNVEYWDVVWQTIFDSTLVSLPRQYSPTILNSPVIAVAATATADYWRNQAIGYINQEIEIGLIGLGFARSTTKRTVFYNELTIINFPFNVDYRLSLDFFTRVANTVTFTVYEYTGEMN